MEFGVGLRQHPDRPFRLGEFRLNVTHDAKGALIASFVRYARDIDASCGGTPLAMSRVLEIWP